MLREGQESTLVRFGGPAGAAYLGHDPQPWVECVADGIRVWSDADDPNAFAIRFSADQLQQALAAAQRDLLDFLGALRAWATPLAPEVTPQYIDAIDQAFEISRL